MSEFYNRALEMKDEFVQIRRHFHMNPERGLDLPKTVDYVMEQLKSWGYDPKPLGKGGVVATAGGKKPGKVIMLRGDMDALPMTEEADIPFASTNGFMHACGHDMHTTMLLLKRFFWIFWILLSVRSFCLPRKEK